MLVFLLQMYVVGTVFRFLVHVINYRKTWFAYVARHPSHSFMGWRFVLDYISYAVVSSIMWPFGLVAEGLVFFSPFNVRHALQAIYALEVVHGYRER